MPDVPNWFGDIVSHPQAVAQADSVDDIVAIIQDPAKYPSPIRAIGSNHSTSSCGVANGGTVIKMGGMNQILNIGPDTVTAQGGALYIDVAKELQKRSLQFYVNTEIGNLTIGSAACCGTKDSSMPGEFGQVGSYVTSIKMVLPSGNLLEVTETQPDLLQLVRSSYGMMGVVYEATFRIRPLQALSVHHETYSLDDFIAKLPDLKKLGYSLMFYIFPYDNQITVEFRRYNPAATGDPDAHVWPLRNYLWAVAGPRVAAQAETDIPIPEVRYKVNAGFSALWRWKLENLIKSDNTVPTDQIIRYPTPSDGSRYTFSFWAFPEDTYPAILRQTFDFCNKYSDDHDYRVNLIFVGYYVFQDQNALLSYSYDGNMITIDPVSTANPGWETFLDAYNQLSSDQGGIPLLNQTPRVTPAQVQKALGSRLVQFAAARQTYDPNNRMLNDFFRDILTVAGAAGG
jgi:FAD/FMN-containing dehydrogenase